FFSNNRRKLAEQLADDSLTVLFAGEAPTKSADESYPFVPNRNLYYMTGIDEPDVILVMKKIHGKVEESIWIKRADPLMEKWVGKTISAEEARDVSGIEKVAWLDTFTAQVHQLFQHENMGRVYLNID